MPFGCGNLVLDATIAAGAADGAGGWPAGVREVVARVRRDGGRAAAIGARESVPADFDDWIEAPGAASGDRLAEAVRGAGIEPARALFVAASPAAVTAGREAGFAAVIGLAREGGAARMRAGGADAVVADLRDAERGAVRRRRSRPIADVPRLASGDSRPLEEWLAGARPAVFLDYDGTLTPIVDDPDAAQLAPQMRAAVRALAARAPVAIVSGRDRADVERRVGIPELYYAGGHGFDIAGPGRRLEHPGGVRALRAVDAAERELVSRVGAVPGAAVERKRFSVAVHYRRVAADRVAEILAAARDATRFGLRRGEGKKVVELGPDVDWHKGRAVTWLLEALDLDAADVVPIFVGDDVTDESGFRALGGDGVGVLVGEPEIDETHADLRLDRVRDVGELLRRLAL